MQKYTFMLMSVIIQTCFAHPIIELPDFHDGGWETVPTSHVPALIPAIAPAVPLAPLPTPIIFTGITTPNPNPNVVGNYPWVYYTPIQPSYYPVQVIPPSSEGDVIQAQLPLSSPSLPINPVDDFFSPQWFPPSLPPIAG